MLLLFVGGVMNIAWIAGLAVLVLAEKLWSRGRQLSRLVGVAALAGGLFPIARYFGIW
jgi:predicted metal-binding membrane protein